MAPGETVRPGTNIAETAAALQQADALNQLAFEIRNSDTPRSIGLSQQAHQLAASLNYANGQAAALNNEGFCYVQLTDYDKALEKLFAARKIFGEQDNKAGMAQVHYNLCIVYFRLGDYSKALDGISQSIQHYESENNTAELARCFFQMGLLYHHLNDSDSAIDYQLRGIALARKAGLHAVEAACKMGLGQVYLHAKQYERAKEYLQESLAIRHSIHDQRGYVAALNAYMTLCMETENYDEAEEVSLRGTRLAAELGDKMAMSRFLADLARVHFKKNNTVLAQEKIQEALAIAEKINLKMAIAPAHLLLSEIYEAGGIYGKALHHYRTYVKVNAEVMDTSAAMKARSIQFANKIEHAQKEAEINRLKHVELKNAFEEIDEKNREITSSITYALRIQTAILPQQKVVKQHLPDSFILYKPKDIVAGDFYWMETAGNRILFAACDCTGHGVPGAIVSVVCHNALNRAVREFGLTQPAAILDKTALLVKDNFSNSEEDIKDGMDVSLCAYDPQTGKLEWAGANNPLWLFRKDGLLETKANKQPVGAHDNYAAFTNHTLSLDPGDSIYLFTDGYADQFGGATGQKKLTKKGFRDLLLSVQGKSMEEQQFILDRFHLDYRNGLEQIDDILVIGVKV